MAGPQNALSIIQLAQMGGFPMFNTTTVKAGIGVALGFLLYMSFIKPAVPFLK